jgi:hypothetical protein
VEPPSPLQLVGRPSSIRSHAPRSPFSCSGLASSLSRVAFFPEFLSSLE